MKIKKALLELEIPFLLLFVCLKYTPLQFLMQEFVLTDSVLIESYSGILATGQIQSMLQIKEKWGWVSFLIPFVFIPLKVLFTTSVLLVGLVLVNREVEFKQADFNCYPFRFCG